MKSIHFKVLAALAVAVAIPALAAREDRPVANFHAIAMGIVMDLEVIQDGQESLSLDASPETLARVETFVRDGTLEIRYVRDTRSHNLDRVRAVVHVRDLDAVGLSAAGNLKAASLKADTLKLSISGAGDMDIGRIAARQATLAISGKGSMNLAGASEQLDARISGMGNIQAGKLETQRATVRISGSGDATLWTKQQLSTAISGMGNIKYYGDPSISKSVSGMGHLTRIAANP